MTRIILEGRQARTISLARIPAPVRVSAPDGSDTDFRLSIPGKIERQFHGILTVQAGDHKLIAVVTMDREVAVASVVAAEMPPSTPMEALKAQAVVARSYFAAAGPRHDAFDFCDTTHCQFLREWPQPSERRISSRSRDPRPGTRLSRKTIRRPVFGILRRPDPFARRRRARGIRITRSAAISAAAIHPAQCRAINSGCARRAPRRWLLTGAGFREILDHYYPGTSVIFFCCHVHQLCVIVMIE